MTFVARQLVVCVGLIPSCAFTHDLVFNDVCVEAHIRRHIRHERCLDGDREFARRYGEFGFGDRYAAHGGLGQLLHGAFLPVDAVDPHFL